MERLDRYSSMHEDVARMHRMLDARIRYARKLKTILWFMSEHHDGGTPGDDDLRAQFHKLMHS